MTDTNSLFVTLDEYQEIKHISKYLVLGYVPREEKLTWRPPQTMVIVKPAILGKCQNCIKRKTDSLPLCLQEPDDEHLCSLLGRKVEILREDIFIRAHYRHNLYVNSHGLFVGCNYYNLAEDDFGREAVFDLRIVRKILPVGKAYDQINFFKHCNGRSEPESAKYSYNIAAHGRGHQLHLNGKTISLSFSKIKKTTH